MLHLFIDTKPKLPRSVLLLRAPKRTCFYVTGRMAEQISLQDASNAPEEEAIKISVEDPLEATSTTQGDTVDDSMNQVYIKLAWCYW